VKKIIFIVFLILSLLAFFIIRFNTTSPQTPKLDYSALNDINSCLKEGGYINVACYDEKITLSKLSSEQLVDDIFPLVESKKVDLVNCHSILHSVGKHAATRGEGYVDSLNNSKKFNFVNSDCMEGFVHGIMEGFALVEGASTDSLNVKVKEVCDSVWEDTHGLATEMLGFANDPYLACAHGSGHTIGTVFEGDYLRGVQLCDIYYSFAARYSCASGLAMEWAIYVLKTKAINGVVPDSNSPLAVNGRATEICFVKTLSEYQAGACLQYMVNFFDRSTIADTEILSVCDLKEESMLAPCGVGAGMRLGTINTKENPLLRIKGCDLHGNDSYKEICWFTYLNVINGYGYKTSILDCEEGLILLGIKSQWVCENVKKLQKA